MKIEEVVKECERLRLDLPGDYDLLKTMRCIWGFSFRQGDAIRRMYQLDDESDPGLMADFLRGRFDQTLPEESDRMLIRARLICAARNLPMMEGRERFELPFRTLESSVLWATTRFWSVARYETVPLLVRWYESQTFDPIECE